MFFTAETAFSLLLNQTKKDMSDNPENKSHDNHLHRNIAIGLSMGVALGAAFGAAFDNPSTCVGVGVGVGAAIGAAIDRILNHESTSGDGLRSGHPSHGGFRE